MQNDAKQLSSPAEGAGSEDAANRPARLGRGGRKSRVEQSENVRERIYRAAAEVVGKVGYADASIALITQRAGVAQGTFYRYFRSRQDLLDKLLPDMGAHLLAHIHERAVGGHGFAELEERSFLGFFSFLRETPPFFRILNEAESFAPKGYKQHFSTVAKRYVAFLRRSLVEGRFPNYEESELEAIAYMLMAARSYLAVRYVGHNGKGELPKGVLDTYMKFILYGLQGVPGRDLAPSGAPAQRRPRASPG